jgi:uncharacterized protein
MMPMRDGVRLATDVYRPKDAAGPVPAIFVKTPYNFNYWDVRNGAPRRHERRADRVRRGYAYVEQNERGHFFSEGNWDILGPPVTDGDDALTWMTSQPWSNGKVGTVGCSSTAEWQMAVAATRAPGLRGDEPAGIRRRRRRVGPVLRAGQLVPRRRRADAVHRVAVRAAEPGAADVPARHTAGGSGASRRPLFDLAPQMPPVDWSKALRHLPVQDILKAVNGPRASSPTRCRCRPAAA